MKRSPQEIARLLRVIRHQKVLHEIEYAQQRARAAEARIEIEHLYSSADASGGLESTFHELFRRRIAKLSSVRSESEVAAEGAATAIGTQKRRLKRAEQHHRTARSAAERQRVESELLELIGSKSATPASRKTGRLK